MAATNIVNVKTTEPNVASDAFTLASIDTTDGALVDVNYKDEQAIFLFTTAASGGATITVKAGNGYAGVNDLTIAVTQNKFNIVTLDTARFANVSGTNKGKIKITTSAAATMAVLTPRV